MNFLMFFSCFLFTGVITSSFANTSSQAIGSSSSIIIKSLRIVQENFILFDIKRVPSGNNNFLYTVLKDSKSIGLLSYDGENIITLSANENIKDDIDYSNLKIIDCVNESKFVEKQGYVSNSGLCNQEYERIAKNLEAKWFRGNELGVNTFYSHSLDGNPQCLSYNGVNCVWLSEQTDSDIRVIDDNSTLRSLENNASRLKLYIDVYDGVRLITSDGNWTGNISLPSQSTNGKVVTLKVNSSWSVTLHDDDDSVQVNSGEIYSMIYIHGRWINFLNNINVNRDLVLGARPLTCGEHHNSVWGVNRL